ncbi:muscarinic acetylcholine receptor M5-like [Coregonus clupeaformis]|uniref:muscarinic acetylcholine receptor M5-like n=1 Tax=Coregonus clupeaformis TaxID=59861 RepID=UPI001BDF7444|nr:muscarinic acetylcholine receptor M5-like [Coregonus clupeaformis]
MLSFKVNSQLKTVNNYYLLSLAFADLIIGVLSMNLYTSYILMGYWSLGNLACDLWLTLDYVASNASVMNLLVISFDRYFSITRPLTYRAKRTPKRAAIMIGLAWLVSFVLWAPPILCWQYFVGDRTVPADQCQIQFFSEPVITFGTAIAAFYIPVSIMTFLYCKIYKETEKRTKDLAELQGLTTSGHPETANKPQKTVLLRSCFSSSNDRRDRRNQASWSSSNQSNVTKTTTRSDELAWDRADQVISFNSYTSSEEETHHPVSVATSQGSSKGRGQTEDGTAAAGYAENEEGEYFPTTTPPPKKPSKKGISYKFKPVSKDTSSPPQNDKKPNTDPKTAPPCPSESDQTGGQNHHQNSSPSSSTNTTTTPKPIDPALKSQITKRKRMVLIKEKKAAQTLSAILLAFILTWTPYNIMVLISTFCSDCIPVSLWHLGYWLCYVNSTINPMCYALCNKTFQKTFKMLLMCQWRKKRGEDKLYWCGQNPAINSKMT